MFAKVTPNKLERLLAECRSKEQKA
jgi:hypothetical protein